MSSLHYDLSVDIIAEKEQILEIVYLPFKNLHLVK